MDKVGLDDDFPFLGEGNLIFVVRAVGKIVSGRSVGKIIIILNLWFGTFKNKNVDRRGKENFVYESDHISLLCDYMMPSSLNFLFFYLFYCIGKEKDHIRRKINSKNKNVYM